MNATEQLARENYNRSTRRAMLGREWGELTDDERSGWLRRASARLADVGTPPSAPEPSQAATEAHGDDERVERYASAIGLSSYHACDEFWKGIVRQVMAVADAEQAELRAEVERLRGTLVGTAFSRMDAAEAEVAQAWDEGFEAAHDWIGRNPGPSGIWSDPPSNPYDAALDGDA